MVRAAIDYMGRRALEYMSRPVVLRRRLPADFGGDPIYVTPDAGLKWWRLKVENADKDLLSWASEFVGEGHVVWDIGANVGLFTFAAASRAGASGHVVAVEPDTRLVGLLRRSARSKSPGRSEVSILPVAVAASVDVARFHIANRHRANNYVEGAHAYAEGGGTREVQLVMTVTLDWLLDRFAAPRVLKIDVEGAEDSVLRGGSRILSEARPIVLCEVARGNARVISDLFHSFGYTLFDLSARKVVEVAPMNTLARPCGGS